MKSSWFTSLFFLTLLLLETSPLIAQEMPVAITNATLITVSGSATGRGTIVFQRGKITAVGQSVSVPQGATVIDGTGKFVMPGLLDPHSHIGVYSYPGVAANSDGNEATAPVTAQVRAFDSFNPEDPAIRLALLGGVTAVQVLPGSANNIGGEGVMMKLKLNAAPNEMRITGAPRILKMAMGENPKRVYGSRNQTPSTLMGNAFVMREAFQQAKEYSEKWERYRKAKASGDKKKMSDVPARDLKLETLAEVLKGNVRVNVHCYTVNHIMTIIRLSEEFGFKITALHHCLEGYKVADELARRNIHAVTFSDLWGFKVEAMEGIAENAAIMHRSGVKVSMHCDHPVIEQRWLIHEAAKAVRAGLPEAEGYKAVTLNTAVLMGMEKRLGSLEAGKDADIVLWSDAPMKISSKVEKVFIDGKLELDLAPAGK